MNVRRKQSQCNGVTLETLARLQDSFRLPMPLQKHSVERNGVPVRSTLSLRVVASRRAHNRNALFHETSPVTILLSESPSAPQPLHVLHDIHYIEGKLSHARPAKFLHDPVAPTRQVLLHRVRY